MRLPPSAWERTPFWLRWRGRERRRVSITMFFLGLDITSKRQWEYRP